MSRSELHRRVLVLALALLVLGGGRGAFAQASTVSFSGGLGLPMSGDGPREDLAYKDLYKPGLSFGAQYRRLFLPHVSGVAELGWSKQPIDAESFAMLLNSGDLVIKGGDLSRIRLSLGPAWESNTVTGPNIVVKVLPSWYRTSPGEITVTSPTQGVIQVSSLSTITDFGLNLGVGMELPIKPNLAIVGGADIDWIFGSDLFDPDRTTSIKTLTAKAGIALWF